MRCLLLLKKIAAAMIRKAETRLGVSLDYAHKIAQTDIGLLMRYNRIFGFLDPNRHVPPLAYHAARLRGAMAADCGTCVEAEINLAKLDGLSDVHIDAVLTADGSLEAPIMAVVRLSDAVVARREDDAEARDAVRAAYGEAGLIELCFAMTGAAVLPGIKRGMGYATTCDLSVLRRISGGA